MKAQYAILRFAKYKGPEIGHIESHNKRTKEKYASNPDVDTARSHRNFHLVTPQRKYRAEAEKQIAEAGCRTRSDSVRVVEALVTASPEFFNGKKKIEVKGYFQEVLDFIREHQDPKTIISAVVHMDEKTPHMHLCFVPLTADKRLSAKEIVGNKKKLTQWQDRFWEHMVKKYPDLERGESASETGRDHIPPRLFKEAVRLNRMKEQILKLMTDTNLLKAIPHKERTAKRLGKMYNKEVKKQLTMSLISDELGQASTKKKEFLGIMEKLIPWSEWVGIVQPHYYKGERGNKPYDLELMLRIYVLQHLYNLADDAAHNEIIDSRAFSQFCGVDSSNQVPDGDTIGRFRHILERNQLGEAFFTNVVESLQKCNLMLKKGTIVDSTLIAAPSSTKNKEKQRDPEAHSVKKGNQWYFGYKEHIGVDADSGLVHTVETTAANVHDSNMVVELLQGTEKEIYGESGYLGAEKKDDVVLVNNEGKPIRYQINKRPSQLKKASGEKFELLKAIEHAKSSVRSKVEHVFCVIKRIFHFCKTRFRGREKLHQHCCTLFALANLYLARNRMKVA